MLGTIRMSGAIGNTSLLVVTKTEQAPGNKKNGRTIARRDLDPEKMMTSASFGSKSGRCRKACRRQEVGLVFRSIKLAVSSRRMTYL